MLVWEELISRELGACKRNHAGAVGCQTRFAGAGKQGKECREQPLAKSLM